MGRELSKLHCRNGAEANSMPSRRRYNYFDIMNEQFLFFPLYLCVNKLSDYKYATMISFLLVHGANKWFQPSIGTASVTLWIDHHPVFKMSKEICSSVPIITQFRVLSGHPRR